VLADRTRQLDGAAMLDARAPQQPVRPRRDPRSDRAASRPGTRTDSLTIAIPNPSPTNETIVSQPCASTGTWRSTPASASADSTASRCGLRDCGSAPQPGTTADVAAPRRGYVASEFGKAIRACMSDHELYDQLRALFQQLNDGHSSIEAPELNRYDSAQVDHEHEGAKLTRGNVIEEYLDDDGMKILTHGNIAYGRIPDPDGRGDIGYISITSMSGMSTADEEPEDTAATRAAMETIMRELGDVSGMIVDVRANGGGWDEVASASITAWTSTLTPSTPLGQLRLTRAEFRESRGGEIRTRALLNRIAERSPHLSFVLGSVSASNASQRLRTVAI
jgi:hypothetical protein